jgi:hypothetical protein
VVDRGLARAGDRERVDGGVHRNTPYFYRVAAFGPGGLTLALANAGRGIGARRGSTSTRIERARFMLVFYLLVLFFMERARTATSRSCAGSGHRRHRGGDRPRHRDGPPVLYVPGIQDIDDIQTVAGLVILESVARLTARYETPIRVPVSLPDPVHDRAGDGEERLPARRPARAIRPRQRAVRVAGAVRVRRRVTGIMLRDRPAAHIFMGSFYAESLMLAETGFRPARSRSPAPRTCTSCRSSSSPATTR